MTIHDHEALGSQPEDAPTAGVTNANVLGLGVRGVLLGLAYGEAHALTRRTPHESTPRRSGVGTQLAAFTTESLVRGLARLDTDGQHGFSGGLWNGLARWAATQGLAPGLTGLYRDLCGGQFPDGWLARVPALRQRRGSAPATVRALEGAVAGTPDRPVTRSHGAHGLIRTLPVAALGVIAPPGLVAGTAWESAHLTHGDPLAAHATVFATMTLSHLLTQGPDLGTAVDFGLGVVKDEAPAQVTDRLGAVTAAGSCRPGDLGTLRRLSPDRSALSAVAAAIYALHSRDLASVLDLVSRGAGDPIAAATVAGALYGGRHTVTGLSPADLAPLEMAWPLEVLARDLALQLTEYPAGGGGRVAFADWKERYPGW